MAKDLDINERRGHVAYEPTTLEFQVLLGRNELYPVSYLVPFTRLLKTISPLMGYCDSQGTHEKVKDKEQHKICKQELLSQLAFTKDSDKREGHLKS